MSRRTSSSAPEPPVELPPPALVGTTPPARPRRRAGVAGDPTDHVDEPGCGAVVLELSDGTRLAVRGSVIIGRQPTQPGRYADALALADRTRTLSRDHLELGLTSAGQVWVCDLGSANGTYVARGPAWNRLTPHRRTPIGTEDVLRFADFSLRISHAP